MLGHTALDQAGLAVLRGVGMPSLMNKGDVLCCHVPQIEFDPSLDVEVVHTPRGWRDPDLFVAAPDFLDAMRPLLNTYLAAQGEAPLEETEWQVGSY